MRWVSDRQDVDGLLSPDVDGVRQLYYIGTRSYVPFEARSAAEGVPVVHIGRFAFHAEAFAWARHVLTTTLARQPRWLVIDEVGQLELQGEGFEPAVGAAVGACRQASSTTGLLLVVRDALLEQAVAHYGLAGHCRTICGPCELGTGT